MQRIYIRQLDSFIPKRQLWLGPVLGSCMNLTKEEVMRRLREGWSLSGDLAKDAPFSLLNPQYTLQAKMATVPVAVVRELSQKNLLQPEPMPGKAMYRLAR